MTIHYLVCEYPLDTDMDSSIVRAIRAEYEVWHHSLEPQPLDSRDWWRWTTEWTGTGGEYLCRL